MLREGFDTLINSTALGRRLRGKFWYRLGYLIAKKNPITFMNYGYVDTDSPTKSVELRESDEKDRTCIQLYHFLASQIDLQDLDVLEVGSGRGGGSSFIARYHKPKSILGLDLNQGQVNFCTEHFSVPGLSFVQGDAENLNFEDNTFNAIINVESSHCYGSMEKFLSEVARVLKRNGYLLLVDFRRKADEALLDGQMKASGMKIVKKQDIAPQVIKAMELESEARLGLVRKYVPKLLQPVYGQTAAAVGSRTYDAFSAREILYLAYVLRNPN